MEYLVQFQLNIYALVILLILLITVLKKTYIKNLARQLFLAAIYVTMVVIIIEPLTWIFDGMTFFGAYFLEYFTNFILILIGPIICGLMLSYVDYYIFKNQERITKRNYYLYPTILTIIMLIINIFYPLYFSVDLTYIGYHAEKYLWIHYVIIIGYYIYMLLFVIVHRKKTYSYAIIIFMVFFTIPIIGMIVQIFVQDFFFSWTSIVLSLLVIYIFLESTTGEKDYLTKLYSRQSYEKYVCHLIDNKKEFSILFIDLDDFKDVNDTKGHFVGDQVLIHFGKTLERVFYPNIMISRLAGDEFIVVLEYLMDSENSVSEIYQLLKNHNNEALRDLKFSYGFQKFEEDMSIDELYVKVDNKMYANKQKNKAASK